MCCKDPQNLHQPFFSMLNLKKSPSSVEKTFPKTNIAPEKGWLEDFLVSFWGPAPLQGRSFREGKPWLN